MKESEKFYKLQRLLDEPNDKTTIVFVNAKQNADMVAKNLDKEGYRVTTLHGGKSQELRVIVWEVSYGAEFVPDAAMKPSVIPAHRSCIDWTPQMYFVGEVVKSLKAGLARRAKLKCSICNLKGAARCTLLV